MGGVSQGAMVLHETSPSGKQQPCAAFQGVVRTENNGGFSSVKWLVGQDALDLSKYNGFSITVMADAAGRSGNSSGNVFQFTLRDETAMSRMACNFKAPMSFGRTIGRGQAWDLDTSAIYEIGFMAA